MTAPANFFLQPSGEDESGGAWFSASYNRLPDGSVGITLDSVASPTFTQDQLTGVIGELLFMYEAIGTGTLAPAEIAAKTVNLGVRPDGTLVEGAIA